ncbi:alpha/beta fold hydrolase [Pediococcus parvulus]|uniref:alpha/beta fold hydrolase n=1 Tax=Pediococcus parvulus TaxID=54062 RepID=UPI00070A5F26|nr:alpha/beta hydrolase [Pediococcus parvulus]MCT3027649.1 alpha/beta hydrolase [Pediococcus parvulus]GEL90140.1 alpha/beta hydrolase [Pediococcus parvulus]GHC04836.1 alpha/beta hydrolase [Pediococcus parvulus]
MKFRTTDNVELDFLDRGQGYPVIFISGFGGYKEIWMLQVNYLLKMGYRVITYDHRNQGSSQRVETNDSLARLILDLRELIQYLQVKNPILIGHSMGASVCYGYLAQFEDVAGVISVDQTPKMLNTSEWQYGFLNATIQNYRQLAKSSPKVRETLHGIDSRVESGLLKQKNNYPFNRSKNVNLLLDHFKQDWVSTLETTKIPVLLIAAIQSPYYDANFVDAVAKSNSMISRAKLTNCGHVIMAEIPNEFNQLLRHFVLKNRYRQLQ